MFSGVCASLSPPEVLPLPRQTADKGMEALRCEPVWTHPHTGAQSAGADALTLVGFRLLALFGLGCSPALPLIPNTSTSLANLKGKPAYACQKCRSKA